MFKKVDPRQNFPAMEKEILSYWKENRIFEQSMEDGQRQPFSFFDGPPFATGLPHYGHVVASLLKDAVPRYWTMRGRRVERRWGWDCHGLPVENLIEKELGIANKQQIEQLGVEKFNEACCASVLRYAREWKEFIPRVGRWVDMEDDYKTMDWKYTESIWWVFSEIYKKGLVYEGYKAMQMCPRCETTLANFEVTQGYKDITDLSATVKFKLTKESAEKILADTLPHPNPLPQGRGGDVADDSNVYVLAWTTTPWTLPGNVALAVGEGIDYALVKTDSGKYLLAKEKAETVFKDQAYELVGEFKGADLVGLAYEPLLDYYAQKEDLDNRANGWKIYAADFVTTEEGVGVVHIAPAFGEDDMALGREKKLPFVQHVSRNGRFVEFMESLGEDKQYFLDKDGLGREVKPKRNPRETDEKVVESLEKRGALFASENYKHSYPHCWRCSTPLLNYASGSWFVEVTKLRDDLVRNNQEVNWMPGYIKDGRFGKWLEDARDWAISRSRFWGAALPIWRCAECGELAVIGSVEELIEKAEPASVEAIRRPDGAYDLHKPHIDRVELPCKCGGKMKLVGDVFDCWFESGSMPYAQLHYPFENREKFEAGFPADFIAEGIDQTRGWFYTLMVLSTALFNKPAFKNVIVNGIVLAEDGQKMSKSLKNYPDPTLIVDKYGADALRYYLLTSPVVKSENIRFSEKGVDEVLKKFVLTLWNTYSFLVMNIELSGASAAEVAAYAPSDNLLDRWIVSELNLLSAEVNRGMEEYDLVRASRPLMDFVDKLSNWYVRRSRRRFTSDNAAERLAALRTLESVLAELTKLMAPFMPFVAEEIFRNLTDGKSVHLEQFPQADAEKIDKELAAQMELVREVVTQGLAERAKTRNKVRQPLPSITLTIRKSGEVAMNDELIEIIKDELNVKEVIVQRDISLKAEPGNFALEGKSAQLHKGVTLQAESGNFISVKLDTTITEELELEGLARETIRQIQAMRKNAGYERSDTVSVRYALAAGADKAAKMFARWAEEIKDECLLGELAPAPGISAPDCDAVAELELGGQMVTFGIKKP